MLEIIQSHIFNSAHTERSLQSIGSRWPVHLIDNSFSGEMKTYCKRNPNVNWIRPDTTSLQSHGIFQWNPLTCAASWNLGLAASASKWTMNVNPDVLLRIDAVDRVMKTLRDRGKNIDLFRSEIGFNIWIGKTAVLQELGGFDDRFQPAGGEDEDMMVRISQAGLKWSPISVPAYHVDGGHLSRVGGYLTETFRQKWDFVPNGPEYKAIVSGGRA